MLAGAGIGLFSGVLITCFGLAAFVVTLGVMAIGRSLAYILSGQQIDLRHPRALQDIVYTTVLGVPSNVVFLLVLYGLAWAYLTYTKGGRTIYAVGSNKEAARAGGPQHPVLYRAALRRSRRARRRGGDALVGADPVGRSADGQRDGTRRHRGRRDRRRQPLRRARLDASAR